MEAQPCPRCDLPHHEWRDAATGYAKDGVTYCCEGCGDGSGCMCRVIVGSGERALTAEEIRDDPASGAFIQSLRKETKVIRPEDYGTDTIEKRSPTGDYSSD